MFNQKFLDDTIPTRSRSKAHVDAASQKTQSTRCSSVKRHAQSLFKPWFTGNNTATSGVAAAASAAAAALQAGTPMSEPTRNSSNAPELPDSGPYNYSNVSNMTAGADMGDKPINKDDIRPMPYHDYNPILVRQTQSDQELPIHYWFYIYLYSSDVDKLLTPFVRMVDSFGTDRRLTVIMNRCGVQILLKELELYKSLPRRIVVIKGAKWTSIVKALIEMEERLPDLMRFATFPLLLDTDTTKYACTKFDRTACINRLAKLIH
ncbi:hypothetical protein BOX15_Mlig018292g1 [Macrostomum lignano]|uniref:CRAL-TRIO domain-containing protein n=2 Tax=Macrostomum lignano TaxID=282301 RepID=A0A1I8ICD7_9PLAT|nr:hypothetical protein BOX15_Mlig018292g3 [Macrostomum lignano]PAA57267.1 hypothetical protein BOX15_Mlig018292g2 [Macrostomum lignano]PAA70746.1 hypothetical protein BOX15_Mlig018292g1 [Macrostomum lignano]